MLSLYWGLIHLANIVYYHFRGILVIRSEKTISLKKTIDRNSQIFKWPLQILMFWSQKRTHDHFSRFRTTSWLNLGKNHMRNQRVENKTIKYASPTFKRATSDTKDLTDSWIDGGRTRVQFDDPRRGTKSHRIKVKCARYCRRHLESK